MKKFKKHIATLLFVSMILVNVLPGFSEGLDFDVKENIGAEEVLDMVTEVDNTNDFQTASKSFLESEEENFDEEIEDELGEGASLIEEPEEDIIEEDNEEIVDENIVASESEIEDVLFDAEEYKEASESEVDEILIATESEIEEVSELATDSDVIKITNFSEASNSEIELSLFMATNSIVDTETHGLGFIPLDIEVPRTKKLLFQNFKSSPQSQYDSRTKTNVETGLSYVPEVRNQGSFGTCWAFSTLGMIETSIRKKGLATTDAESNLSEATLAYFYYHLNSIYNANKLVNMGKPGVQGEDYVEIVSESQSPNSGSNNWSQIGGNQLPATLFMSGFAGSAIEEDGIRYSDMGTAGSPGSIFSGIDPKYAYNSNAYVINNVNYFNKADTDLIKQAIMDNGSVGISYYEDQASINAADGTYYYKTSGTSNPNHAVMVVGWDDTIPKGKFPNSATHDGGWLVRNSWGSNSRDHGYFWMSYDEPSLYDVVFSIDAIKADTYKYNYHYDTTGIVYAAPLQIKKAGNIYKVTNDTDQLLEAISFPFASTNVNYKISIYTKDTAMTNPENGTLACTQTGQTTSAGIYTIPLNNNVLLKKGTYFSVVVSSNTASKFGTYVDSSADGGSIKFYNYQLSGQTFCDIGSGWIDYITSGNPYGSGDFTVRVKALTNPCADIVQVTFNSNGGTTISPQLIASGSLAVRPNNPSRSGYTFVNWYKESGLINVFDFSAPITSDTTIYAKWTQNGGGGGGGGSSGGGGGGGGGGGRGGGGGGGLPGAVVPKQTDAKIIQARPVKDTVLLSTNVTWNYDPIKGTWSLNVDKTNPSALAANTFIAIASIDPTTGQVKNDVYNFDENGNMVTGWAKDATGAMYFFNANQGADIGKMAIGWTQIGTGVWYFFDGAGKLVMNGTTPDGKIVGVDGSWHDPNAQTQIATGPGF